MDGLVTYEPPAARTETGGYQIDAAELSRAFPFPAPGQATHETDAAPGVVAHHATEIATLTERVRGLEAMTDKLPVRSDRTANAVANTREGYRGWPREDVMAITKRRFLLGQGRMELQRAIPDAQAVQELLRATH